MCGGSARCRGLWGEMKRAMCGGQGTRAGVSADDRGRGSFVSDLDTRTRALRCTFLAGHGSKFKGRRRRALAGNVYIRQETVRSRHPAARDAFYEASLRAENPRGPQETERCRCPAPLTGTVRRTSFVTRRECVDSFRSIDGFATPDSPTGGRAGLRALSETFVRRGGCLGPLRVPGPAV